MLSFLEFIDHFDLDLFLKEKGLIKTEKKVILTFCFLNFFFKGIKGLEKDGIYRSEKNYKKKFIDMLNEKNLWYEELSFNEIYKIKEDIGFDKILIDCKNKTNRIIDKMKWLVVKKNDLRDIINNPEYIKKYKSIKEIDEMSIVNVLTYYSNYLEVGHEEIQKCNEISIL